MILNRINQYPRGLIHLPLCYCYREDDVFQVKVLDASGSIYPVDVTEDTTIGDLKQKVAMESGVEIERQRHIFLGKVLENRQTLKGVNAKPGCTIHLFQRPKEIIPHVSAEECEEGTLQAIHINGGNGTSNGNVNAFFAFSVQLPGSSQPVISIDAETLELEGAVRGLLMISACLIFLSILQSLRSLVLLKGKLLLLVSFLLLLNNYFLRIRYNNLFLTCNV